MKVKRRNRRRRRATRSQRAEEKNEAKTRRVLATLRRYSQCLRVL